MTIYLDHASTSWPRAPGVAAAMADALDTPGSAGRGSSRGSVAGTAVAHALRAALAELVNAREPCRMILTSGATEALNVAIAGVVAAASARGLVPRVVTTQIEHNAVRRPLAAMHAEKRIELTIVPGDREGVVDAAAIAEAARGAALVAMTWASNVTGAVQPVEQVAAALRGTGTLLLVDASQTAGLIRPAMPLDELGIDLLAFSGHKALAGPPGVGALYIGPRAHPTRADEPRDARALVWPTRFGGTGGDSAAWHMPLELPQRFEPGTPDTPAHAGLLCAARCAAAPEAALARVRALMDHLRRRLDPAPRGLRWLGPVDPTERVGVAAFTLAGYVAEDAAAVLESEFGIVVRAGLHCAPGGHEAIGTGATGGAIRISVGQTTTERDIDAVSEAIRSMAAHPE